jgi:hypothetical protein
MADRVIVVGSTDAEVLASVEASPEFIGWHIQGTVSKYAVDRRLCSYSY